MDSKLNKKPVKMKKAAIDQVIAFLILFIGIITVFFFILEYHRVIMAREEVTTLSNLGARVISIGGTEQDVIDRVNEVHSDLITDVSIADLNCVDQGTDNFRIIFIVQATVDNDFVPNNQVAHSVGVFNEVNSNDIRCVLQVNGN